MRPPREGHGLASTFGSAASPSAAPWVCGVGSGTVSNARLMDPELFKEFCSEFIREVNRLRQNQASQRSALDAERARIGRPIRKIVDAIADGVPARSLNDELLGLEAREDEINVKLATTPEPKVYLAPNMAEIYRQRVRELQQVLAAGSEQTQRARPCRGRAEDRSARGSRSNPAVLCRGKESSISARRECPYN
jgi:site-specific DNA recombinase